MLMLMMLLMLMLMLVLVLVLVVCTVQLCGGSDTDARLPTVSGTSSSYDQVRPDIQSVLEHDTSSGPQSWVVSSGRVEGCVVVACSQ